MKNPPLALHPDERVWLAEYRQALNERHPGVVVRMVVYGSKARGDAHEDSDIDVLLIVKNEAADLKLPLRRIGYRLSATSYAVPSILAYTQEEWAAYKNGMLFHPEMASFRKRLIRSLFAVRLENCFSHTSVKRASTLRLIDS